MIINLELHDYRGEMPLLLQQILLIPISDTCSTHGIYPNFHSYDGIAST